MPGIENTGTMKAAQPHTHAPRDYALAHWEPRGLVN